MSATHDAPTVAVFGAGAIGCTVGGWLAEHHPHVWFIDHPSVVERLRAEGLTLYAQDTPDAPLTLRVQAAARLTDMPRPDLLLLAVKTYSLDTVCTIVREQIGDAVSVIGLQNGIDNQRILPRHFANALYAVVGYNAWVDAPGKVGFQKRGPLILGHPEGQHRELAQRWAALLSKGVETLAIDAFQDAVHSKMIVNLTNSLQTLIGHPSQPISDRRLFQRLLTTMLYEGVRIVQAAGYRECRIGGLPRWALVKAGATLPLWVTRGAFERNVKKMVISSMAQDVLQRGAHATELDAINGYMLELADRHRVRAPTLRAITELCRTRFAAERFAPATLDEVAAAVSAAPT